MSNILVIEDDADTRELMKRFLVDEGHMPLVFPKAEHAALILDTMVPDLALLDINLPGEHGVAFAWDLRNLMPHVPIIVTSGELHRWDEADIRDCGADEVLAKPVDLDELRQLIDTHLAETQGKVRDG